MGITFTDQSTTKIFDARTKLMLPVSTGLEYHNLFGTEAALNVRNLAPYKGAATVFGALALETDHVVMTSQTNYIKSGVPQTASATIFAVAVPTAEAANAPVISNAGSDWIDGAGTTPGVILYMNEYINGDSSGRWSFGVGEDASGSVVGNVVQCTNQPFSPGSPSLLVARYDAATRTRTIFDITRGETVTGAASVNGAALGGELLVGGTYVSGYSQPIEVYYAGIFSAALSDGDIASNAAFISDLMLKLHGLTV